MAVTQKACFAAGCFWGVQAFFDELPGVTKTTVGYCGGHSDHPTYKQVCRGDTGHAEALLIEFDPDIISFNDLIDKFWECHNPSQSNGQGPDRGSQYRSLIFYFNPEQQAQAEAAKQQLAESGQYQNPIATQIEPMATFFEAEEDHQKYHQKHGGSCGI